MTIIILIGFTILLIMQAFLWNFEDDSHALGNVVMLGGGIVASLVMWGVYWWVS